MRAEIHHGPEPKLHKEAGYISASPLNRDGTHAPEGDFASRTRSIFGLRMEFLTGPVE